MCVGEVDSAEVTTGVWVVEDVTGPCALVSALVLPPGGEYELGPEMTAGGE